MLVVLHLRYPATSALGWLMYLHHDRYLQRLQRFLVLVNSNHAPAPIAFAPGLLRPDCDRCRLVCSDRCTPQRFGAPVGSTARLVPTVAAPGRNSPDNNRLEPAYGDRCTP